jgi:uncharacterized protein YbcC (UPF0753/DUF2309 family)
VPEMPPTLKTSTAPKRAVEEIKRVCVLIPPSWGLRSFVAVNPFLGHTSMPIDGAARTLHDSLGAKLLPPISYFSLRWREGAFTTTEVVQAARRLGIKPETLVGTLDGRMPSPARVRLPHWTMAEWIDWRESTTWNQTVCEALARWCESEARTRGALDVEHAPRPFSRWLSYACIDRSVDVAGLVGFRAVLATMPQDPDEAIALVLEELGIDCTEREPYLLRLLAGIYGWATHARRIAWERDPSEPGAVRDLLAARACLDLAVARTVGRQTGRGAQRPIVSVAAEDERTRLALQEALEDGYTVGLLDAVHTPDSDEEWIRPALQAVFCIDVRSEPIRRHLERLSSAVETKGFAGFFGVAMEWNDAGVASSRCPVLLKSCCTVHAAPQRDPLLGGVSERFHSAPASALSAVEIVGLAYAAGIALGESRSIGRGRSEETSPLSLTPEADGSGFGEVSRVELADSILRGMGMQRGFAPIVMLCGHASHSVNNPHASSLDCGACGGHGGAPNARVACAILNDVIVRASLRSRGWRIPDDTLFVAAVHDTSDDSIRVLDVERVPASHVRAVQEVQELLDSASAAARTERAPSLGIARDRGHRTILRALRRRTSDWAVVRPEWGLAGNAAFVAARRSRTRALNLGGRTFLHDYDANFDEDGSLLKVILSAPMVVASWINLQYLASTVDSDIFGSGDKALHNRVGDIGVVVGSRGDLRTGLPLQSVQDVDGRWRHEPLRLQVIVEATTDRIDAVLRDRPHVAELIENGWVRLFALSPESDARSRFIPGEGWEPV